MLLALGECMIDSHGSLQLNEMNEWSCVCLCMHAEQRAA